MCNATAGTEHCLQNKMETTWCLRLSFDRPWYEILINAIYLRHKTKFELLAKNFKNLSIFFNFSDFRPIYMLKTLSER